MTYLNEIVQQKLDSTDHYLTKYSELNENNTQKKSEIFENFFFFIFTFQIEFTGKMCKQNQIQRINTFKDTVK